MVALYTPGGSGRLLILAAYPTVAVAATLALALLVADLQRPLGHEGRGRSEPGRLSRGPKRDDDSFAAAGGGSKATAAVRLLLTNRKCLLMLPTNAAFGLASAFITAYVNGSVVSPVRSEVRGGSGEDKVRGERRCTKRRAVDKHPSGAHGC